MALAVGPHQFKKDRSSYGEDQVCCLCSSSRGGVVADRFGAATGQPGGRYQPITRWQIAVINTQAFPEQVGELRQKYDQVNNQFKERYEKLKALDNQLNRWRRTTDENARARSR